MLAATAESGSDLSPVSIAIAIVVLLAWYFLPTLIASARKLDVDSKGKVFGINFFLGWCILGWGYAMYLALTGRSHRKPRSAPTRPQPPVAQSDPTSPFKV